MDRTKEVLVASDAVIIKVRNSLLRAAKELQEEKEPVWPHKPEFIERVRNSATSCMWKFEMPV